MSRPGRTPTKPTGTKPTATKPTAAKPTAAQVELAARLDQALSRLVRWSRRQSPSPFGPGVLSALGTVVDSGPLRLGDLAAREAVAPATLSRVVATLEDEGYLRRAVDPDDRRSAFVAATREGQRLVRSLRRERGERIASRLPPLTDAGQQALLEVIEAVEQLVAE